ncbi:MAG TPA: hypothetical protein VGL91_17210 [Acidobacteriota bacterium]
MNPRANKRLSRWKLSRYSVEAAGLRLLERLIPLLSLRTVRGLGRGLGWIAYYLLTRKRWLAHANLDIVFGDTKSRREKSAIARASFQNFAATELTLFWAPRVTRQAAEQLVQQDAAELQRVRGLVARGKGAIFIGMHYGDWELLGLTSPFFGITANIVARELRNPKASAIVDRLRSASGQQIVPRRGAVSKLLGALRRGELITLLIDLNAPHGEGGIWVDLFGLSVLASTTAATLARRTGAPIIPVAAEPLSGGRIRISWGGEITRGKGDNSSAEIQNIAQRCMHSCEAVIRAKPEYWLWAYKRWKYCPTAARERYPYYAKCADSSQ